MAKDQEFDPGKAIFEGLILCDGILQDRLQQVVEESGVGTTQDDMMAYKAKLRAEIAGRGHVVSDDAWDDIFSTVKTASIFQVTDVIMNDVEKLGGYIALEILNNRSEKLRDEAAAVDNKTGYVEASTLAIELIHEQVGNLVGQMRKGLGIQTESALDILLAQKPALLAA